MSHILFCDWKLSLGRSTELIYLEISAHVDNIKFHSINRCDVVVNFAFFFYRDFSFE